MRLDVAINLNKKDKERVDQLLELANHDTETLEIISLQSNVKVKIKTNFY